jgi:hypothetical protein
VRSRKAIVTSGSPFPSWQTPEERGFSSESVAGVQAITLQEEESDSPTHKEQREVIPVPRRWATGQTKQHMPTTAPQCPWGYQRLLS